MKRCSLISSQVGIKRQKGVSLIEALIAVLLVGLMSQGAVYLSTRATATQTTQQMLNMAVTQLRSRLIENNDICASAPAIADAVQLPNSVSLTAEIQGCDSEATVSIDGINIPGVPRPISLSVDSPLLGGQVVVGGTWN